MNGKQLPLGSALVFCALTLTLGFVVGYGVKGGETASASVFEGDSAPEGVDFSPVWKAWRVIDERFVPASVATSSATSSVAEGTPEERRVWGMIQGLAASLDDPYTFFLPPVENTQFADDMSGQFEGVGMEIAVRNQVLTVVTPLKGTPAERAGIKSGDLILKIDGTETRGMDVNNAIKRIRGKKGTQVKLEILREGWSEPKEIAVTRDVISVPVIQTKARPDGVFVITVSTFTSNAPELFRSALREFVQSGYTRLVLDLRGNPGGYLEAAVNMASWFLPSGAVVVTEDYAGHTQNIVHRSSGYNIFNKNLKMAILVDRGSASASEILADALRHYGVGKMIGANTFGKGSVQELVQITPNTSLKITVARWLGPGGAQIPLTGLVPDIVATTTEDALKNGEDPQLEAAVRYLLSI